MATRRTLAVGISASTGDIGVTLLRMPARVLAGRGMVSAVLIRQPAARAGPALVISFGCRVAGPVVTVRAAGRSVFGARTRHDAVGGTSPRTDVVIRTLNRGGCGCWCCGCWCCRATPVATPTIIATPCATSVATPTIIATAARIAALCMPARVLAGTGMVGTVLIGETAARAGTALVIGFCCLVATPIVSVRAAGRSVLCAGTADDAVGGTSPRTDVVIRTLNRGGTPTIVAATCATTIIATTGATTSAEAPQMPTGTRSRAGTLKTTTTTVIAEIKGTERAARSRTRTTATVDAATVSAATVSAATVAPAGVPCPGTGTGGCHACERRAVDRRCKVHSSGHFQDRFCPRIRI